MRVHWLARPLLALFVGAGIAVGIWYARGGAQSGEQELFTVAANTFKSEFESGEPAPLVVALGYAGTDAVHLAKVDCFGLEIADAKGDRVVPSGLLEEPGPPPGEYFMRIGSKQVFVLPVQQLQPGGSLSEVIADALRALHPLPRGTYSIVAVASVKQFGKDAIIEREGLTPETWAPADSHTSFFYARSNPVTIQVR